MPRSSISRDGSGSRRCRRRAVGAGFALATVVLAASAAACSGSSGASDAATASTTATTATTAATTTTRPVVTRDQLEPAALAVSDLPPGWAIESSGTTTTARGATSPAGSSQSDADQFLCPGVGPSLGGGKSDEVEAKFTMSPNGPFLMQELIAGPDAAAGLGEVKRLFGTCVGQTWTKADKDLPMSMTMAEASAPKVGDGAAAYRITGTTTKAPLTMLIDFVVVQRATVVQVYAAVSIQSPLVPATQLSGEQLAGIVTTGDQKVAKQVAA